MAIGQITLNDGTVDHDYDPITVNGAQVLYRDITNSSLALPKNLEISHQPGSISRPDRHLVKLSLTDDNTDGTAVETATVHVVFTQPRSIVTISQATNLSAQLANFLSNPAYLSAVLNGAFPA